MVGRSAVAVIAGVLLLAGCTATPAPAPSDGSIPSIAGEWVLTRAVTESSEGSGYAVGDLETRYLSIADADCTASACTGMLLTSDRVSVFDGGDGDSLEYRWDGSNFSYDKAPVRFDCLDAHGKVVVVGAYEMSFSTDFEARDPGASGFDGTMGVDVETRDLDADAAAEFAAQNCPPGGVTTYAVKIDPH